jgi:glucose dehydrogenase
MGDSLPMAFMLTTLPMENMVIDVERDGRKVKTAVQANKTGFVYTMNRLEGKLVSAAPSARREEMGRPAV